MVLVSFPTIGNVSSIASDYLVKKLRLERIGAIASKKSTRELLEKGIIRGMK